MLVLLACIYVHSMLASCACVLYYPRRFVCYDSLQTAQTHRRYVSLITLAHPCMVGAFLSTSCLLFVPGAFLSSADSRTSEARFRFEEHTTGASKQAAYHTTAHHTSVGNTSSRLLAWVPHFYQVGHFAREISLHRGRPHQEEEIFLA